jgi:hypothetical protein
MAVYQDIAAYAGDTWDHVTVVRKTSGVADNLTGYTAKMTVRRADNELAAEYTSDASDLIITALEGKAALAIPASKTKLDAGIYKYDLQITNGTIVRTLIQGRLVVTGEVTL